MDAGAPLHFEPKDEPLRGDVGRFGALVGELRRGTSAAQVREALATLVVGLRNTG